MTTSQQIIDRACDAGAEFELLRDCNGAYALLHVPGVGTLSARESDSETARYSIAEQIETRRETAYNDAADAAGDGLRKAQSKWPALPNLQPITTKLHKIDPSKFQ